MGNGHEPSRPGRHRTQGLALTFLVALGLGTLLAAILALPAFADPLTWSTVMPSSTRAAAKKMTVVSRALTTITLPRTTTTRRTPPASSTTSTTSPPSDGSTGAQQRMRESQVFRAEVLAKQLEVQRISLELEAMGEALAKIVEDYDFRTVQLEEAGTRVVRLQREISLAQEQLAAAARMLDERLVGTWPISYAGWALFSL